MRLVDFFRLSVKVDRPMVTLDDELELLYQKQLEEDAKEAAND